MAIDTTVLGKRIKECRQKLNMNQRQFANFAGIDSASLNRYESGKQDPRLDTLILLASKLNVCLDYLIYGTGGGQSCLSTGANQSDNERVCRAWVELIKYRAIAFTEDERGNERAIVFSDNLSLLCFLTDVSKLLSFNQKVDQKALDDLIEQLIKTYLPKIQKDEIILEGDEGESALLRYKYSQLNGEENKDAFINEFAKQYRKNGK